MKDNLDRLKQLLTDPVQERLLVDNYENLAARVQENGYLPESLTGAYGGMFPRTIGGWAKLFSCTERLDLIEKVLSYCFRAMDQFEMHTVPHVIGKENADGTILRVDTVDQIDGQAHVVLAWAMLALRRPKNDAFIRGTCDRVMGLMDRSTSGAYLCSEEKHIARWRIEPGLVLNTHLEHSRDHQYWHAYDILTQSFICAALEKMCLVAADKGHKARGERWRKRLEILEKNIAVNLVRRVEEKTIYAEMLLPTGRAPEMFEGISWLNLAPVAAGWSGVDKNILRNTIDLWFDRGQIVWKDLRIPASDWLPGERGDMVITKVLGWHLLYSVQQGCYDRAADTLDFLARVNSDRLYSEAFRYDNATESWKLCDPGNGEQTVWLCWSMTETRKLLGLSPLP